ncbi:hypothetical protein D3OALGA1CA_2128 [Olavius algarvensis associated proteobacterium Delta 3]|nr:hypothetical protein D3OALGB2SA_677 [Olavius algarvensis associated proteobacterium Delta 3]CAB5112811.1 hypothetical protein D3OALGA1CA_2128 [Olavius algarvensis associated proteobacterium Delta 3]
MEAHVQIKLFANLKKFLPETADRYPIAPGISVKDLLIQMQVPLEESKLIFVNGVKSAPEALLRGGERIGVFPPVGGG